LASFPPLPQLQPPACRSHPIILIPPLRSGRRKKILLPHWSWWLGCWLAVGLGCGCGYVDVSPHLFHLFSVASIPVNPTSCLIHQSTNPPIHHPPGRQLVLRAIVCSVHTWRRCRCRRRRIYDLRLFLLFQDSSILLVLLLRLISLLLLEHIFYASPRRIAFDKLPFPTEI